MLKSVGDILPDPSDDCRFNLIKHKEEYYKKIVSDCTECGGSGFTGTTTKPCSCSESLKLILELLKSNFPQQHLGIINEDFFPRMYVELDIYNSVFSENKTSVKTSKPKDFKKDFLVPFLKNKNFMIDNSCSALFTGNNETGKTYAALLMLAKMIRSGYSGHYLRFKNYLNLLNSSYGNNDDKIIIRQIRNVKFLVIDELGKEHGKAEYATTELEELIKTRQDNLSSTILITNLDYSDFVSVYGSHVKSSFNKNFKVLIFHPDAGFRKKTRVSWPDIT